MGTHLININDCTTPTDTAQNFPHLMPLTLYPLEDKSMTTIGKAKVVSQRLRESNRAPGQEGAETIDSLIVEFEKSNKDATRWAFFRKQICIGDMEVFERAFACFDGADECTESELDTAIDDAIRTQGHAK